MSIVHFPLKALTVIMTFQYAHPFKAHEDTLDIPKDKQRDVEDIYRW